MTKEYSAKDIVALKYPDQVRLNPGMYVGGSNQFGLHQCIYEFISNAVDEHLAGHCSEIYVRHNEKLNTIIICDNGRGMPIDKHTDTGESAIYLILASLHAGGKMRGSDAYSATGGIHGVGAAAGNALAAELRVQTYKNEQWWEVGYKQGILTQKLKKIDGNDRMIKRFSVGTQISFTPDIEIFKKNSTISVDILSELLKDLSYLCSTLTIYFEPHEKEIRKLKQEDGGAQFVLDQFSSRSSENIIKLSAKPYRYKSDNLEVALLWTTDDEERWSAYTNCIKNPNLGIHADTMKQIIDKTFKKVFDKSGYTGTALRQGLLGFLSLRLKGRPEYEGQTKNKLTSDEAKDIVQELQEDFERWVRQTRACQKIISFAIQRGRATSRMNEELSKQIQELASEIKDANKRKYVFCTKLKDAYGCRPDEKELFLVEGESASGPLMQARDDSYQAILELKGKFTNAYKDKPKSFFQNEDVRNIFTSIGVVPGEKDYMKKIKIGRLIWVADSDPDGRHINSLGFALTIRFLRELIKEGRVYVVKAPLYSFTDAKGNKSYALNDKEKEIFLKKHKDKKFQITRFKGWGECLNFSTYLFSDKGLLTYEETAKLYGLPTKCSGIKDDNYYGVSGIRIKKDKAVGGMELLTIQKKESLTIKTKLGYTISSSHGHKHLIMRKGILIEERAKNIIVGDHLLLNRHINVWGSKSIPLDMARLAGHIIADGSFHHTSFSLHDSRNSAYQRDVIKIFEDRKAVCEYSENTRISKNSSVIHASTYKQPAGLRIPKTKGNLVIFEQLRKIKPYGNAHTKQIPLFIRQATKEVVCSFLKTYMGRDGCITRRVKNTYEIELSSVSASLIKQTQLLLLNLGIVSRIHEKQNGSFKPNSLIWVLSIMGTENLILYRKHIGFLDDEQKRRLDFACSVKANSNIDVIPGIKKIWHKMQKIFRLNKYNNSYLVNTKKIKLSAPKESIAQDVSLSWFLTHWVPKLKTFKVLDPIFYRELKYIERIKPFFVKITNIESGEKIKMFDLGFSNNPIFTANGIITHNSNPEFIKQFVTDPETRTLIKVKYSKKSRRLVEKIMGEDVSYRKKMLHIETRENEEVVDQ